ncbi:MAG TPA: hypothetical protein VG406_15060 [Isosphaeraceae bacterium]|jgi:hypothetical protein|nr:hypothetical protein [Isosphaeraceae bacterium]
MRTTAATPARAGYSLTLALVFIVLMLGVIALASRRIGTALRVVTSRSQQLARDEGALQAAASALDLLETGNPPSDPFVCQVVVKGATDGVERTITVTFASEGTGLWAVTAAPARPDDPTTPMPATFATQ